MGEEGVREAAYVFPAGNESNLALGSEERIAGPLSPTRSVIVLLPALNEAMALGTVLDRMPFGELRTAGYECGVWVVDGKSTDGTLEIARARGARVFVQRGEGKGNGIRQAMNHIMRSQTGDAWGSRMFVMLDADGSYAPEEIPKLVRALEAGSDVVAGSRITGNIEDGAIPPLNQIGNVLLSKLARVLFGTSVSDVCTGMWAFREDALRHFGLSAKGFDLEADLFASCCETGARLEELPIGYYRRIGVPKLVPLRTGLLIAWRLIMRRLNRPEDARTRPDREGAPFAEEPV